MDIFSQVSVSIVIIEALLSAVMVVYLTYAYVTGRLTVRRNGEGDEQAISITLTPKPQGKEDESSVEPPWRE